MQYDFLHGRNWNGNLPFKPDDPDDRPAGGSRPNDPMTRTTLGGFGNIHVNGTLK